MPDKHKRTLQTVVYLLLLSTILGLGSNAVRHPTLPLFKPLPSLFSGEISLQDADQLLTSEQAVFWDVRSDQAFQRVHIPGALSPVDTPKPGRMVIVYCSGRLCPKARDAAERLRSQGYRDVLVMPDGIKGWKSAGYPLQRGDR